MDDELFPKCGNEMYPTCGVCNECPSCSAKDARTAELEKVVEAVREWEEARLNRKTMRNMVARRRLSDALRALDAKKGG